MSRSADLVRVTALKAKALDLQRESDKARFAYESILERLKEEFDCSSLKAAREELKKLKRRLEISESKFEKAMEEFEERWEDKLNG